MTVFAFDARPSRPSGVAPGGAPRGGPSTPVLDLPCPGAFATLARVLHEDFDVLHERVRPDSTLAGLGLSQLHWWCLHEAVLETLPQLGTHPLFRHLDAIHRPLAELARWEPVVEPPRVTASAPVRRLRAPATA